MPTVQRPKVEKFTVDMVEPVDVERRLNADGDEWQYRIKRSTSGSWSFWMSRRILEGSWDNITLPPDPEIPQPRVTMPVEVYDENGAIAISDEMVMVHAYDLRVGDQLRIGSDAWEPITNVSGIGSSSPIQYRTENYGATRQTAPWFMVTIKIAE